MRIEHRVVIRIEHLGGIAKVVISRYGRKAEYHSLGVGDTLELDASIQLPIPKQWEIVQEDEEN